jgi:hypothetical protein
MGGGSNVNRRKGGKGEWGGGWKEGGCEKVGIRGCH